MLITDRNCPPQNDCAIPDAAALDSHAVPSSGELQARFGGQLVGAYFLVFYLAPWLGNELFAENIRSIYRIEPVTVGTVVLLAGVYGVFLVMSNGPRLRLLPSWLSALMQRAVETIGATYTRYRLQFAAGLLALVAVNAAQGFSNYRYSNVSLSESGSLFGLFVIVLNTIVTIDMFHCMFVRPGVPSVLSRRYLENVLLAITLLIAANGTAGALMALASLGYSLCPAAFHSVLFQRRAERLTVKLRRSLVGLAAGALAFGSSWIVGETIKTSAAQGGQDPASAAAAVWDYLRGGSGWLENYGYYLIGGISTHYYSLTLTAAAPSDALTGGAAWAVAHPLQSLAFRVDYLIGSPFGVPRPQYGSLSRLNYATLSDEQTISLRSGTSPGLIASFNYVLSFPFNVLVCGAYLCWVARLIDRLLATHRSESLSAMGLLLLLFSMRLLFESPVDYLILFDDVAFAVALLWAMALVPPPAPE